MSVARAFPQVKKAELKDGSNLLYTGTGAVQQTGSCVNTARPRHELYAAVQVYASVQEDAPAMKKLISAYTRAVERSAECRAGSD
ncbi:hypothetical protein [Streptomyces sulfonofaciens]|uniref:hypothetical protein n=1 Tax=Streptomyces sulfonofaciens TaxID=68272 RepID=UPI001675DA1B|nr:hypothetical protein [Streptomyces sulfonofaciens]